MAETIAPASKSALRAAAPGPRFLGNLLDDYVRNLPRFFDPTTGAVVEAQGDAGTPAFLSTEVTGCAIRELMTLYKMTTDLRRFEHAWRAGAWLLNFAFSALLEYCAAWVCRHSPVLVLAGGIGSRC